MAPSRLHADERGSIIAHTDDTGARTQTNTYDAYGNPGPSNAGLFQYTGQVWLEGAGVYYYKNRTYHAELGVRPALHSLRASRSHSCRPTRSGIAAG